ncbi:hypothetical protein AAY473_028645 [Plecturocebus cupreus]
MEHFGRLRQADHLMSGVQNQPDQHGETPSIKIQTTSWVWWCMPVISATREAQAGESLEPGRQRLRCTSTFAGEGLADNHTNLLLGILTVGKGGDIELPKVTTHVARAAPPVHCNIYAWDPIIVQASRS